MKTAALTIALVTLAGQTAAVKDTITNAKKAAGV